MKRFHLGRSAIAAALGLVLSFVATQSSADGPAQKGQAPAPVAGQAPNTELPGRSAAEALIRDFETASLGVDIETELKLIDNQSERLAVILNRIRRETSSARRFPPIPAADLDEAARKRLLDEAEATTAALERAKNDILAVLTDEQMRRMEQIRLQARLQLSGMSRALASDPSAKSLNLTANQILQLQDAEKAAQEQFLKEISTLREQQRQRLVEAKKKVLSVLTPEQQAKYEKRIGSPLEIADRRLEYGVAGISSRLGRDGPGFGGFGRGGFRGAALPNLPPPAANPAAPAPANPKH